MSDIRHMTVDPSNLQLEALTGMDLGDCIISRNNFPCQGTSHLSCFLSTGTEGVVSSMAKVQLVSVVGGIREDESWDGKGRKVWDVLLRHIHS